MVHFVSLWINNFNFIDAGNWICCMKFNSRNSWKPKTTTINLYKDTVYNYFFFIFYRKNFKLARFIFLQIKIFFIIMASLSTARLAFNWFLVLILPLPGIYAAWWLRRAKCDPDTFCSFTQSNSMIGFNVLLFFNFDIGYWLASLLLGSLWLIDFNWFLIP